MKEDWIETSIINLISERGVFCDGDWIESKDQDPNGDVRLIQLADIGDGFFRDKSSRFLTSEKCKELKCTFLNKGDIILARMPDPLGRATLFPLIGESKYVTVVDVAIIRVGNTFVDNKFLLYNINSLNIRNKIEELQSGSTRKRISRKNLSKINFPIAPLPEQRAIVAKIEGLFSSLDSGISDLKKAQEQLKIYRQAVLKKAFEGEWNTITVGDLFDFIGGGTPSKREKNYWGGDIPWASVKDIKGDFLNETQDYITEIGVENSSTNIAKKGEVILITRISPGRSLITNIDTAINQDLKVVKPKEEIYNHYVYYLFKSIERDCIKLSSGTTVKGINLTNLKSIEIPKIDLTEQHQIVQEIESRLSVCDKVENDIKESLEKSKALRQSILKKAFEGKLLNDAEIVACKSAEDYEPASVLLERIKKAAVKKRK